ncbi:MAG: hypothetical protein WD534_01325 [Phycisphaeraceae bacterium]
MRRRLLLLLLVLAVLAVALVVTVQLVLVSDLPRRVVVARLQDRLGLDVQIDSLRARWSGHAEARGVRVSLPLEGAPFLEAPVLQLKHTSLLRILFTWNAEVESVFVDEPVLRAVQRSEGHWNLQQVQEVLAANLGSDTPRDRPGPLPLPELALRDVRLVVDRLNRDVVELEGVRITGRRRPPLAYVMELDVPRMGGAEVHFSRAAPFTHELTFDFAPEPALVKALAADVVDATSAPRLVGAWRGRITRQELRGTLELDEASIAAARLHGTAELSARTDSPALTLEPTSLALIFEPAMPEPVYMVGGRLLVTEADVQWQDVRIAGYGGRALVRGQLDLETLTGELGGTWEGLALPTGFEHAGELDLRLTRRGPAHRLVNATIDTRGHSAYGNWNGVIELSAAGETYADLTGTLRSREMRYEMRGHRYRFADLSASFATSETSIRVTQFDLGEPDAEMHLAGHGEYDWVDRTWSAAFTGRDLLLPSPAPSVTRLRVEARGDAAGIELRDAEIDVLGMEVEASGGYVFADPEPLTLRVRLRQAPIRIGDAQSPLVQASNVVGALDAQGTLQPLALQARGKLVAEGVQVHRDTLGNIELQVRANVDESAAAFEAEAIEWLGGQWQLRAAYNRDEQLGRVFVDAKEVDLSLAQRLVDPTAELAVGRADLSLEAEAVERGPQAMRVDGTFALRDLELAPWGPHPATVHAERVSLGEPVEVDEFDVDEAHPVMLQAERVTGRVSLRSGQARLTELLAEQGEGRVTGEAAVNLARPSEVRFDVSLNDWPLRLLEAGRLDTWVTGRAHGEVDAAARTGEADARLSLQLASAELAIGQVDLHAELAGSMLHLRSLEGRPLRGRVQGDGQVDVHDPWRTARLAVNWGDLQPRELEQWAPVLRRMTGTLGGSLTVEPTNDRRALGPLRAELTLEASDATFRDLPIGDGHAVAYLDRDRLVLQNLMVEAMGGHIGAWGRVSEQAGERFVFASGWLTNLDLAMISEATRPDEEPLLGRLSANVSLSAPLADRRNVFGSGSVTLRESDIGAIPLISVLYDLANIALVGREPEGRGQGQFRFEEGAVLVERFFYQNRGLTIRLSGRVQDMWQGLDSPFEGVASLSLAPLPDVELLEVLNEAFTALQADMTTARLTGRINDPDPPQIVPFRGVWDAVRRVMGRSERE